jgi:hypothetical protein
MIHHQLWKFKAGIKNNLFFLHKISEKLNEFSRGNNYCSIKLGKFEQKTFPNKNTQTDKERKKTKKKPEVRFQIENQFSNNFQ